LTQNSNYLQNQELEQFEHQVCICLTVLQSLHLGSAYIQGAEAASTAWTVISFSAWFSSKFQLCISSYAFWTEKPSLCNSWFIDCLCFYFCFLFAVCRSQFFFARIAVLFIANWQPLISWSRAAFIGLDGLCMHCLSKALIVVAWYCNSRILWGVSDTQLVRILPAQLPRDVRVLSYILSCISTQSGQNSINLAAAKPFLIFSDLKASV